MPLHPTARVLAIKKWTNSFYITCPFPIHNNNRFIMVLHLVRIRSAYKDLKICSFYHAHICTHMHTHTHTQHTRTHTHVDTSAPPTPLTLMYTWYLSHRWDSHTLYKARLHGMKASLFFDSRHLHSHLVLQYSHQHMKMTQTSTV